MNAGGSIARAIFEVRAQKVTPLRIGKNSYFVKPYKSTLTRTTKRLLQPKPAIPHDEKHHRKIGPNP
jgi:hypothetical protein